MGVPNSWTDVQYGIVKQLEALEPQKQAAEASGTDAQKAAVYRAITAARRALAAAEDAALELENSAPLFPVTQQDFTLKT